MIDHLRASTVGGRHVSKRAAVRQTEAPMVTIKELIQLRADAP